MVQINDPINLNTLDSPNVDGTQFTPDMKQWLSIIVDVINSNFSTLNNLLTNFISSDGIDVGGGGAGPLTVTVLGLTPSGFVNVDLISTSNLGITILSVVPGNNSFQITFSGDPGASAIIVYQAYIAQPT